MTQYIARVILIVSLGRLALEATAEVKMKRYQINEAQPARANVERAERRERELATAAMDAYACPECGDDADPFLDFFAQWRSTTCAACGYTAELRFFIGGGA